MKYYRTKEDILKLAAEFKPGFKYRPQLSDLIKTKYSMTELGYFTSIMKDSVWFGNARGGKDNQFQISREVCDYIIDSGIFDDAVNDNLLVTVFGSVKNGEVIDITAINIHNMVDPANIS